MTNVFQSQRYYNDNGKHFTQKSIINEDIVITINIEFLSDKFIEFQKEIFQEQFIVLEEQLTNLADNTESAIKKSLEIILQNINSKLTIFAEKINKTDFFPIKGAIKVYANNILFASLIGNSSILIFRESGLYYSVNNDYSQQGRIDLFSEFIEGEVQNNDNVILIGNDIHMVFDQKEIKKFNEIFVQGGHESMDFLEETMSMRINKEEIGFMVQDSINNIKQNKTTSNNHSTKYTKRLPSFQGLLNKSQNYKYFIAVGLLLGLILILAISAIKGGSTPKPTYIDEGGNEHTISPSQIKKDLAYFKLLDATSSEKSHLYRETILKLDQLESQGFWPEDVDQRRKILEQEYNEGFNIIYETDLSNFDEELTNTKAQLLAFTDDELNTIGEPTSLIVTHQIVVGGSHGALISPVNEEIRGTPISNNGETTYIGCSSNILRDGLYCFDEVGNISNITKAGTVAVTTETPGGFPSDIVGLDIFGKTNLYVLTNNQYDNEEGIYISRYRNVVGTQNQFNIGDNYILPINSGEQVPEITNFTIDGNFLVRNNSKKTIQQRRREGATFSLNSRDIEIIGGTQTAEEFGSNIKILSTINTRYVLLFDVNNQTLTVYDSTGIKTNDAYTTNYNLKYVMKFKFDLTDENIVDMAISEGDGNKLQLYMLSNVGIYKIKLYDLIESAKDNKS